MMQSWNAAAQIHISRFMFYSFLSRKTDRRRKKTFNTLSTPENLCLYYRRCRTGSELRTVIKTVIEFIRNSISIFYILIFAREQLSHDKRRETNERASISQIQLDVPDLLVLVCSMSRSLLLRLDTKVNHISRRSEIFTFGAHTCLTKPGRERN